MNNVNLSGRFTADPVIRYSKSNYAFASFTLAVDRYSHRDGEPSTDFIDCYAIGRTAEHIEKYFFRGMRAEITGQIQTSTFKNRNEQSIKSTRLFVEKIQFGESKAASDSFRGAAHYDNPVDSSSSNQHSASQVPNNQQSRSCFPSHNNGTAAPQNNMPTGNSQNNAGFFPTDQVTYDQQTLQFPPTSNDDGFMNIPDELLKEMPFE